MKRTVRKKRNTKRRWIALAAAAAVLLSVACAVLAYRTIAARRVRGWQQEGVAAARVGEYAKASELLLKYLRKHPDDAGALEWYAKAREQAELPGGRHVAETIGALQMLLKLEPERMADRRRLMALYAKAGQWRAVVSESNYLISKDPADVAALAAKIEALRAMGQDADALRAAEAWATAAPKDLAAQAARVSLSVRTGKKAQDVLADVRRIQEGDPAEPRFAALTGVAHALAGDAAEAAKWFGQAAARVSPSDDYAETLVVEMERANLATEASALLRRLASSEAGDRFKHALARRAWERRDWAGVIAVLPSVAANDPAADATLLAFQATALARTGKKPESDAVRAALKVQDRAAARSWGFLLDGILDGAAVDDRVLLKELATALAVERDNAYLAYFAGEAYARLGEGDLAQAVWQHATSKNLTWTTPLLRLSEVWLERGRPERALPLAGLALRRNPGDANAAGLVARSRAAELDRGGNVDRQELASLVKQVQDQVPGEPNTLLIQVRLLAGSDATKEEAIKITRTALARRPALPQATLLALASASRERGLGVEEECYTASQAAHGVTPELAYAKAVGAARSGDTQASVRQFDASIPKGQESAVHWALTRARLLDAVGDPSAAQAWVALGDARPDDPEVQRQCAAARAAESDRAFMLRTAERLRAISGEQALAWRLLKARVLTAPEGTDKELGDGAVLLNEIIRANPEFIEARVLLGRALVRMKRYGGATEHLGVATRLDPTDPAVGLEFAGALQARGDAPGVRKEIERIAPLLRPGAGRARAVMLLSQQGDRDRAVSLLQEYRNAGGGDDPGETLLLAGLYRQQGRIDQAETLVTPLLDRAEPDPNVVRFAASLYAAQGRPADAERVLSKLDSGKLAPGVKELVRAAYLTERLDHRGAAEQARAATRGLPTNPASWQLLVGALAASGSLDEAFAAVDEALKHLPRHTEFRTLRTRSPLLREAAGDEDLRPWVVSVMRDPAANEGTIDLLAMVMEHRRKLDVEGLVGQLRVRLQERPNFLPARVLLAQTLWAMGRKQQAVLAARQAMDAAPGDPAAAKLAVQLGSASGDWGLVEEASRVWKRQGAPAEQLAADVAAARALLGRQEFAQAASLLRPRVATAMSDPDRSAELLTVYAVARANAGEAGAVEEELWALVDRSPQWRAQWVRIVLSLRDPRQALAWLDRLASAVPPDAAEENLVLAEAYDVLGSLSRLNDAPLRERATTLYRKVAQRSDASAQVCLAVAARSEQRGELAEAEAFYRRAIEKDPSLWVAYNNLAMVLLSKAVATDEAVRHARTAVKLQPRLAVTHDTLASALSASQDARGAAESAKVATQLEPENAAWRVRLARYQLESGNFAAAAETVRSIDAGRLDLTGMPPELGRELDGVRRRLRGEKGQEAAQASGADGVR